MRNLDGELTTQEFEFLFHSLSLCNFCLCMLCIDVFSNLERLASGQLHLSAIITMFTDTNSVPSSNAATAGLIQVRTIYPIWLQGPSY